MRNIFSFRKWVPAMGLVSACLFAPQVWALPCVNGDTLDQYITAGSCTVGDQTYTFTSSSFSSSTVADTSITVDVITTVGNEGLTFQTSELTAPVGGGMVDMDIAFTVTTTNPEITDASLTISGSVSNRGAGNYITVGETVEPAGDATQYLQQSIPSSNDDVAEVYFAATDDVYVVKDAIALSCTPDGETCTSPNIASLSLIQENFSESESVPEPASIGILGAGLVALGVIRRRRSKVY